MVNCVEGKQAPVLTLFLAGGGGALEALPQVFFVCYCQTPGDIRHNYVWESFKATFINKIAQKSSVYVELSARQSDYLRLFYFLSHKNFKNIIF